MFNKTKVEELSVEELEKLLLIKKRQSRLERFQKLSERGHSANEALVGADPYPRPAPAPKPPVPQSRPSIATPGFRAAVARPLSSRWWRRKERNDSVGELNGSKRALDFLLLGLEVTSLVALVGVLIASYFNLRELNDEVSIAQQKAVEVQAPTPTPAPAIALQRLPGGHSSPTSPGGAAPDVPPHLQQWVQPSTSTTAAAAIPVSAPATKLPTRIVIPKINVDAPIVSGVTWEDLKKGVGHLPGSASPGERGNLYLAAHNDIFGEIFRYLEKLEPGDEYIIYAGEEPFRYVAKEKRIIEPTQVEVMMPTTEPVATLQTCYPYLVDTHRLVVIGELAE